MYLYCYHYYYCISRFGYSTRRRSKWSTRISSSINHSFCYYLFYNFFLFLNNLFSKTIKLESANVIQYRYENNYTFLILPLILGVKIFLDVFRYCLKTDINIIYIQSRKKIRIMIFLYFLNIFNRFQKFFNKVSNMSI